MSSIKISEKIREKLDRIKNEYGAKTYNEVIQILLLKFEKYENSDNK